MNSIPDSLRFWGRVTRPEDATACWLWQGARKSGGGLRYGHLRYDGHTVLAHRLAWELTHGPIPPGLCVCHRCDNPICCNPAHLFLGTHSDNMRDREQKGRHNAPRGERHHKCRLTAEHVREIRTLAAQGVTLVSLARRYGVTPESIGAVVHRITWQHIE